MARVLVVDDEPKLGRLCAEMLELDGHAVTRVDGGRPALVELGARPFDVVLTDLKMPDVDGMAVLSAARERSPAPEVIVMTAFGSTEEAVAAMKAGAADYLSKPFVMDELRLRVRRLAAARSAEARSARLVERLTPSLVAESEKMRAVLLDEPAGHGQAQARPLGLGREVEIEHAPAGPLGDAGPAIVDEDPHGAAAPLGAHEDLPLPLRLGGVG